MSNVYTKLINTKNDNNSQSLVSSLISSLFSWKNILYYGIISLVIFGLIMLISQVMKNKINIEQNKRDIFNITTLLNDAKKYAHNNNSKMNKSIDYIARYIKGLNR